MLKKPLIAVPLGDPAGIGPEIVARSIADKDLFAITDCIVIGDRKVMENAIRITLEATGPESRRILVRG